MGIRMLYFNTTFLKMCFVIQFLCVKRFLLEKIVPKGHELVINEPAKCIMASGMNGCYFVL